MIDQLERRFYRADGSRSGRLLALDHHHLDAKRARCGDLGIGRCAAGILADDHCDIVFMQQSGFIARVERSARQNIAAVRHFERRNHRINAAHEIGMLRHGRELPGFLPPDRQEHATRRAVQCFDRARDIGHGNPSVALLPFPARTAEAENRRPASFGCRCCIGGNPVRKRMGGINEQIDPFVSQVINETIGATKTTNTRRQGQGFRIHRATRERDRRLNVSAQRQTLGQLPRFGRAAEDQDAVLAHG